MTALLVAGAGTQAHAQSTAPTPENTDAPKTAFLINSFTQPSPLPAPAVLHADGASFTLADNIAIDWLSPQTPALAQAVARFEHRLETLAGRPLTFTQAARDTPGFTLHIGYEKNAPFPSPAMREGYKLRVAPDGITLNAQEPVGVLRGLVTVLQLVRQGSDGPIMAQASVEDAPRFAWRGLMLDVSRHFMSMPALLRQLDAMELVKLDVLHIHFSDGAAFRVQSRRYPLLQDIGSHGQFYTQDQIRDLVAQAALRGIRIVPEFDTPGHTFALLQAYPRYAAILPLNTTDRAEINRAALDPTKPETLAFVNALYTEMAALFPDPVFHIGGDEVVARQWLQAPAIVAYMKSHALATPADLQAAFTRQVARFLHAHGKTVMGWDEVLAADTPPDTIIESWRGPAHTAQATQQGHPTVVSGPYYLDRLLPAQAYYDTDPFDTRKDASEAQAAAQTTGPGGTIAAPPPDKADDAPVSPLSDEQKSHVLGAETALWAEVVSEDMLDARLWPRAAALAERFWSAPARCESATLAPRLAILRDELDVLGLHAASGPARMLARLAPGQTEAAAVLFDVVSPVRNYAHNHEFLQIRHKQQAMLQALGTPADIASPDSFTADAFNAEAAAYTQGMMELKPDLERSLTLWANNDAAFMRDAAHNPALAEAIPASAELAALARAGLAALGVERTPGWRENARETLDHARAEIAASASIHVVTNATQPPGDLIQRIVPGVAQLVEQAER
ncbi:beta-N-acetylhexosaminidase [Acetobacter sp. TBRC 12305]|uniref:beta-N-acetylhexosaminidase n=2 Tax=Acetobacter garciniae TaxID=2817435 RepID=A0A939HMF4_9PROT|nr:family 20 glycosylhydrolase [Acetobacter garciniae]MBX0343255.1 beta-N-acetylhexosaminidase [Acetobacter garciniae]